MKTFTLALVLSFFAHAHADDCVPTPGDAAEAFRLIQTPTVSAAEIAEFIKAHPLPDVAIDQRCHTPLHAAAASGRVDLFDLFYALHGNPDVNQAYRRGEIRLASLYEFALSGNSWALVERVRALGGDLRKNPDVYSDMGELRLAASDAGPEVIGRLLEESTSQLNTESYLGTPLMIAARDNPNVEVLRLLMRAGAAVNPKRTSSSPNGEDIFPSPLSLAVQNNTVEIAKSLVSAGAKVEFMQKNDWPLIIYSTLNRPEMIEYVIKLGADVNLKNEDGDTALIYAAQCYSPRIRGRQYDCRKKIAVLLKAGAKRSIRGSDGMTAQNWAYRYGAPDDVVKMLAF